MKIIGHRGARGLAPENTIASFQKALEHKVNEIEFDVRVTKDGIPVLYHRQKLRDASGNRLDLADHIFEELKNHKPDLITLEEALETFATKVPLYIEVKRGEPAKPIAKVIRKYRHNRLFVGSKSQKTLRELHKLLPDVPKIVIEPWSGVKTTYRARALNTKLISMNQRFLWFGFISAMRRRGYELYAYTMNNPKKARRWGEYGLAGVVTDFPDRFLGLSRIAVGGPPPLVAAAPFLAFPDIPLPSVRLWRPRRWRWQFVGSRRCERHQQRRYQLCSS